MAADTALPPRPLVMPEGWADLPGPGSPPTGGRPGTPERSGWDDPPRDREVSFQPELMPTRILPGTFLPVRLATAAGLRYSPM